MGTGYNRPVKNFDQDTVKQLQTVAAIVVPGYADLDQSSREQFLEIDRGLAPKT